MDLSYKEFQKKFIPDIYTQLSGEHRYELYQIVLASKTISIELLSSVISDNSLSSYGLSRKRAEWFRMKTYQYIHTV
jgi:hypothetical protein